MFKHTIDEGKLSSSGNDYQHRWKSSLLWYFVTDLGLELTGQITLSKVLYRTAKHYPDKTAILEKKSGHYLATSYSKLLNQSEFFASALISLGLQTNDRVAIFLKNSLEWVISDFGSMMAGCMTVPLYGTLVPSAISFILQDSAASILLVEDQLQFEKIYPHWGECPDLRWMIIKNNGEISNDPRILSFESLLGRGEQDLDRNKKEIERRREEAKHSDVATIVYTSGTTGNSKGVMLTHRNILSNVLGVLAISEANENDRCLSILPLSHAFERSIGYYLPILIGATIAYSESFETILQNLQEVHPTYCAAVPRMFEKIYERVRRNLEQSGRFKRALFQWALKVGAELAQYKEMILSLKHPDRRLRHRPEDRENFEEPPIKKIGLWVKWQLARILVYKKFKKMLGGKLKYFVSGGAPLRGEICQFFRNLDICIYEGYGLTETSPVIAFNYRNKWQPGTVGKLLPWVQIKIAPDGEICIKGPNVMKGYFNNPTATKEVFDEEGWFLTGDIGYMDENNYLHITDRKKELIVMSNGKKVAPLVIEGWLNASPWISQSVVIGNNRKYIAALIIPSLGEIDQWAQKEKGVGRQDSPLIENEKVKELFDRVVDEINQNLSSFEQIKRFVLLPHELTQEGGELTPTLKIKRKVVEKKYEKEIESLYPNAPFSEEGKLKAG